MTTWSYADDELASAAQAEQMRQMVAKLKSELAIAQSASGQGFFGWLTTVDWSKPFGGDVSAAARAGLKIAGKRIEFLEFSQMPDTAAGLKTFQEFSDAAADIHSSIAGFSDAVGSWTFSAVVTRNVKTYTDIPGNVSNTVKGLIPDTSTWIIVGVVAVGILMLISFSHAAGGSVGARVAA